MEKDKFISRFLKIIAILIFVYGLWVFFDWRLWRNMTTDFGNMLQIFLPILVLGFSGCLYGISCLLIKNNK